MKILSKFKDYYDYVAHQYGGGDPKITYVRKNFSNKESYVKIPSSLRKEINTFLPYLPKSHNQPFNNMHIEFKLLVVCGKSYLTVSRGKNSNYDVYTYGEYTIINTVDHSDIVDAICNKKQRWMFDYTQYKISDLVGVTSPVLIEISRLIKAPIFFITNYLSDGDYIGVEIDMKCPILKNTGIASIVSTETMYQELSYFVGNMLYDTPDAKPPVEISNMDKISKAGFDLKKSFRNCK